MTQPSLDTTFDTSLIDIQRSFSSTETNTSGSSGKENVKPRLIRMVSTHETYEQWAATYDTDGNILQKVDDLQLEELMPRFAHLVETKVRTDDETKARAENSQVRIMDLGCGTGRNTVKLLRLPWTALTRITGFDASEAMLAVAQTKCNAVSHPTAAFSLERRDFGDPTKLHPADIEAFSGLISTLVLEHLPLVTFFSVVRSLLATGGIALITNMHPDMGSSTQAGFRLVSGERVLGTSFVHGVQQTMDAARDAGLVVEGIVDEFDVIQDMIPRLGEKGRKWVGRKVWYGLILRRT